MAENLKVRDRMKNYALVPMLLTIPFAAVSAILFAVDCRAGIAVTAFTAGYFVLMLVYHSYNKPRVYDELVNFATQYGTVQRKLLNELTVPHAILDRNGRLLWLNQEFCKLTGKSKDYRKSITSIFPEITKEKLEKETDMDLMVSYEDRIFRAHIRKVFFQDPVVEEKKKKKKRIDEITSEDVDRLKEDAQKNGSYLTMVYLFDETLLTRYRRENQDMQLVAGLVYIDNYDELSDAIDDVKRSLFMAMIDRKVNRFFNSVDGLVKKFEKDKYFVVFKRSCLDELEEKKFALLEEVKSIKTGDQSVTLSMGFGYVGSSYVRNYEVARAAIDLALGRGGDQAVVKTADKISYYGGNSQHSEKTTRVKARVKAQALREIMMTHENFYIMGHSLADIDAFGAAIGIYCAARQIGKKAQIILGTVTTSLRPFRNCFTPEKGYPDDMIIGPQQALEQMGPDSVLIVVDTNRPSYTESIQVLAKARTVIVFDHHRVGEETIRNAVLSYIEPYASSTCEMIAEVLQYFDEDIKLSGEEADAIYAGILIDTYNFMSKTGVRTFEAAVYLRRNGVNITKVRKMLRNDMATYKARAEAVENAEVYRDHFVISVCPSEHVASPTIASSQAANELLNVFGIKASFVLTEYNGKIYISSRSIDEINVQLIMERLGGGGHMSTAGAQLTNCSLEEAKRVIKNTLDEMIREGDISD